MLCSLLGNIIGEAGVAALGKALEMNSSLQALECVGFGGDVWLGVVEALGVAETMWVVLMRSGDVSCSLFNNNIGAGGAVALAKALEVNLSLQTLG